MKQKNNILDEINILLCKFFSGKHDRSAVLTQLKELRTNLRADALRKLIPIEDAVMANMTVDLILNQLTTN